MNQVIIGEIVKPHGISGQIVVHVFCEKPQNLCQYGDIFKKNGEKIEIKVLRSLTLHSVIAQVKGCCNRNEAEELRATQLFIERSQLPLSLQTDEFYIYDLIGVSVFSAKTQTQLGYVIYVHNLGAGPFLEIKPSETSLIKTSVKTIPFTADAIEKIDLEHNMLVVHEDFIL